MARNARLRPARQESSGRRATAAGRRRHGAARGVVAAAGRFAGAPPRVRPPCGRDQTPGARGGASQNDRFRLNKRVRPGDVWSQRRNVRLGSRLCENSGENCICSPPASWLTMQAAPQLDQRRRDHIMRHMAVSGGQGGQIPRGPRWGSRSARSWSSGSGALTIPSVLLGGLPEDAGVEGFCFAPSDGRRSARQPSEPIFGAARRSGRLSGCRWKGPRLDEQP